MSVRNPAERILLGILALVLCAPGCGSRGEDNARTESEPVPPDTLRLDEENHLRNVRQLTFGGENAEAYFSPDGEELVFQSTRPPYECDQIFRISATGGEPTVVSNELGRTTCSYFLPDGESILYSSTYLGSARCPESPDYSQGYVWAVYPDYDVFVRTPEDSLVQLTDVPGYDAEATVSPTGDRIVFTSLRSGDLDIYSMNLDGTGVTQLTSELGYEGGPFYSPDGKEIVFRANYPANNEERDDYMGLLSQGLIRPGVLSLYVMNADGTNRRLVLENGAANFCPYFFPDGERIIFASNLADEQGRNFDLYMIHKDGSGLERLTYDESFDAFPMFSPDGRYLVWASNRNNARPHETNIFIAEWME